MENSFYVPCIFRRYHSGLLYRLRVFKVGLDKFHLLEELRLVFVRYWNFNFPINVLWKMSMLWSYCFSWKNHWRYVRLKDGERQCIVPPSVAWVPFWCPFPRDPFGLGVPIPAANYGPAVFSTETKIFTIGGDATRSTCSVDTIFGWVKGCDVYKETVGFYGIIRWGNRFPIWKILMLVLAGA